MVRKTSPVGKVPSTSSETCHVILSRMFRLISILWSSSGDDRDKYRDTSTSTVLFRTTHGATASFTSSSGDTMESYRNHFLFLFVTFKDIVLNHCLETCMHFPGFQRPRVLLPLIGPSGYVTQDGTGGVSFNTVNGRGLTKLQEEALCLTVTSSCQKFTTACL